MDQQLTAPAVWASIFDLILSHLYSIIARPMQCNSSGCRKEKTEAQGLDININPTAQASINFQQYGSIWHIRGSTLLRRIGHYKNRCGVSMKLVPVGGLLRVYPPTNWKGDPIIFRHEPGHWLCLHVHIRVFRQNIRHDVGKPCHKKIIHVQKSTNISALRDHGKANNMHWKY